MRKRELYTGLAVALGFILLCQHTADQGQGISFMVYYASMLLRLLYAGLFLCIYKEQAEKEHHRAPGSLSRLHRGCGQYGGHRHNHHQPYQLCKGQ